MTRIYIVHPIGHVTQSTPSYCWAAALAMAMGQVRGRHRWEWDIRRMAQGAGVQTSADGGLVTGGRDRNERRLATAVGMRLLEVWPDRPVTLSLLGRLLGRGRVVVMGYMTIPGLGSGWHAVTVYRMFGDDAGDAVTVSYVDPSDGRAHNMTWPAFRSNILSRSRFLFYK